jgi:cyclopropane-fatty-acyl-phospholipid synthase
MIHHGPGGGPWVVRMRDWHFNHHYHRPNRCFGVTTRFWDGIFGTGNSVHDRTGA